MSKLTIIEGNSNDKDNTRLFMVKGERGDDGVSPTIDVEKEDGVTTLTIEDAEGTKTATIADGTDLTGGVPTNAVIGWDSNDTIPDGYENYNGYNESSIPSKNVGLERIFRYLDDTAIVSMQGGCVTPNNTILVAMWDGNTDDNKVLEISLSTGQILKQQTYTWGWCNGLGFDSKNNKVYVAHRGKKENNTSVHLKTISVLNYADLTLDTTITFSDYVMSVNYDKSTEKLYFMNEWDERNTYGFKIYEVNPSNSYAITNTITLDYSATDVNKLKIQNFCIAGGYIYVISSEPRALLIYDMTGNLVQRYNLPEYINKIYYSGEYQWVDALADGSLYVGSGDNAGVESINQVHKLSLTQEYIEGDTNEATVHAGSSYTVYVDASSTAINPNGSSTNKFKSINEATRFQTTNRGCNIQIANGTYNGVYLRSRDHINFTGASQSVIIKGFNINYCTHVTIDTATIEDCQFDQAGVVNILYSTVYLKGLAINDTNGLYGINVGQFSECNMSVSMSISTTNANQIYVRNDSLLILNQGYWQVQKHQKASKIIGNGKIRMFATPTDKVVGEFTIDSSFAYTEYKFYSYFNYIVFRYKVGSSEYVHRVPAFSSANGGWIEFINLTGTGTEKVSQVYYSFDTTNAKLKLQYSRVYTRDATGACTAEVNEDNSNPVSDSIVITDVYLE